MNNKYASRARLGVVFLLDALFRYRNGHVVVHTFEKHLSLVVNEPSLFGTFQRSNQSLVVLLSLFVVKKLSKGALGRRGRVIRESPDIFEELLDLRL